MLQDYFVVIHASPWRGGKLASAIQVAKATFNEFFGGAERVLEARLAFEAAGGHQSWVPPGAVFSDAESVWHEAMSAAFDAVCEQVPVKTDDEHWSAVYIDVMPLAGPEYQTELAWRAAYIGAARDAGGAADDGYVEQCSAWSWRSSALADPVFMARQAFKKQLSPGTPEFDAYWQGRTDPQRAWPTSSSMPARLRPPPAKSHALDGRAASGQGADNEGERS